MNACPECGSVLPHLSDLLAAETEAQLGHKEREVRRLVSENTRLRNKIEAQTVSKRDGAVWERILGAHREAFPDRKLSAVGVKSARATAVFARIEQGATVEDWLDAIRGGQEFPYVVYGERRATGSTADRADDLQDFAHLSKDRLFEFLRDAGRAFANR